MTTAKKSFGELLRYTGLVGLPEGVEDLWSEYEEDNRTFLIDRTFLDTVFKRCDVPGQVQQEMLAALEEIERDADFFTISKFIVHDMCSDRNRVDNESYGAMQPSCMAKYGEYYSFLLLLACVEPSMKMLEERGIPFDRYRHLPWQPMERQFRKLIEMQDPTVSDFSWDMHLYTCAIFLFGRFYIIPIQFVENFVLFRDLHHGTVLALRLTGETFRSDGQYDGINGIYDEGGRFETIWEENNHTIRAHVSSPMGFVRKEPEVFHKHDLKPELEPGHMLLSIHIPSGPDYTPERLKEAMEESLAFFDRYYPELDIKGFWSESWCYDSRLSLVLDEESSRLIQMQRQLYLHPIEEGDLMLRYEVFGDWDADPATFDAKASLQKAVQTYMKDGGRFNSQGMTVLRDDVAKIPNRPYITDADIAEYRLLMES